MKFKFVCGNRHVTATFRINKIIVVPEKNNVPYEGTVRGVAKKNQIPEEKIHFCLFKLKCNKASVFPQNLKKANVGFVG